MKYTHTHTHTHTHLTQVANNHSFFLSLRDPAKALPPQTVQERLADVYRLTGPLSTRKGRVCISTGIFVSYPRGALPVHGNGVRQMLPPAHASFSVRSSG